MKATENERKKGEGGEDIANEDVSRRRFLKVAVVGAAGLAITTAPSILAAGDSSGDKKTGKRYGMILDLRKCVNCKSCQVQCKTRGDVPIGVFRSWVKAMEIGEFPNVSEAYLPVMCNHCENAPCVKVCPTQASFTNEDGLVLINQDKCIGCKACIAACPYEMRFIHPEKKVADKCDMCVDRLERSELPACVTSCPFGARIFGDLNDPESEISKILANEPVEVLKPEKGTKPKVFYIGLDGRIRDAVDKQEEAS